MGRAQRADKLRMLLCPPQPGAAQVGGGQKCHRGDNAAAGGSDWWERRWGEGHRRRLEGRLTVGNQAPAPR